MAFHKTSLYPAHDQQIAFYAKSISHPERIRILKSLRTVHRMHVRQLHKDSPLALPTMSQHLAILRRAELVDYLIRDPYIYYSLNELQCRQAFARVLELMEDVGYNVFNRSA